MSLREDALAIWQAGLHAVDAAQLVRDQVRVEDQRGRAVLVVGEADFEFDSLRRLIVVGAGKAGAAMAQGLEQALEECLHELPGRTLPIEGWVNIPEGTERPTRQIHLHTARPAGVNEPTERGIAGSEKILQLVRSAGQGDLCIALLSGGGSALLPLPADGITLDDKRCVARVLSGRGANIEQLNVVRKHLSAIKGGKLAAACGAANLVTLVISDVLGDPLDLIASGPTVADPSSSKDALRVLRQFDVDAEIPAHVYRFLEEHTDDRRGSAFKASHPSAAHSVTVIGNNAVAVDGAGMEAERRGYSHAMTSARRSEGSAESVGRHLAEMARSMLSDHHGAHEPDCWISGGEPVVRLAPPDVRGRGGRNQHLVLAALDHLMHLDPPLSSDERDRVVLMSGGTDGEDGPTDAAGAFVDAQVWARTESLGIDVRDYLRRSDAYSFFDAVGGLIRTGPTHTNVCDLRVLVVGKQVRLKA